MTTPALSFGLRKRGRHYPYEPCDVTSWPRNQWGSVNPEDVPDDCDPRPSVTNILSVSDKPALKGWAAEQALLDLYESGSLPLDVNEAITKHKYAFDRRARERADAGTRAHTLAERLTRDLPLPASISDEDEAYADAYLAFWADHDPEPIHVEATVYGDFYAGTGDLVAAIDGQAVVVDYKTRGERDDKKIKRYGLLYDEARMQLAALAHATEVAELVGDDWKLAPTPAITAGMGVVLFPDGTYATETLDEADLGFWFAGFRGAHGLWCALKGVRHG